MIMWYWNSWDNYDFLICPFHSSTQPLNECSDEQSAFRCFWYFSLSGQFSHHTLRINATAQLFTLQKLFEMIQMFWRILWYSSMQFCRKAVLLRPLSSLLFGRNGRFIPQAVGWFDAQIFHKLWGVVIPVMCDAGVQCWPSLKSCRCDTSSLSEMRVWKCAALFERFPHAPRLSIAHCWKLWRRHSYSWV